ncbi:MAG: hypothetical protein MRJ66_00220 [Nitrospira sp.]|nr:hypothetical protein [Nitrospira sp.]
MNHHRRSIRRIRTFLLAEASAFAIAALVHVGFLADGYEHHDVVVFESILGSVLLLGYLGAGVYPAWVRQTGMVAQGMALFGTVIGRFSVIADNGLWTILELVFYRLITAALIWGFIVTIMAPTSNALASMPRDVEADKARD